MCVYIYIYTYTYTCACAYMCTHINTYVCRSFLQGVFRRSLVRTQEKKWHTEKKKVRLLNVELCIRGCTCCSVLQCSIHMAIDTTMCCSVLQCVAAAARRAVYSQLVGLFDVWGKRTTGVVELGVRASGVCAHFKRLVKMKRKMKFH